LLDEQGARYAIVPSRAGPVGTGHWSRLKQWAKGTVSLSLCQIQSRPVYSISGGTSVPPAARYARTGRDPVRMRTRFLSAEPILDRHHPSKAVAYPGKNYGL